ncbi:tripartite motif-containing protein 77-like [Choloepus didactylus]|uniref:tripartite motif-containing protein 77-like n=1 Tax=Choloepus didactylus TaxID=27675 RepID=UPI00189F6CF4|nr:tripartite motif-containing protein 77-like [Choloepus didactylus]
MDSDVLQCSCMELTCPICRDYFIDPVTISCRHSFCRPCLYLLWEDAQTPTHCPVCRAISQQTDFKPNIFLKKQVSLTRRAVFCQLPTSAMQICSRHQAIKNLFCEADKSLLCLFCCKSQAHFAHTHCPIEQAAEEYREKLLMQMKSIWETRQKNQRNLNKETSIIRGWADYVNQRMVMIRAEFPKLFQYLHKEKQNHLNGLEMVGKAIFKLLKESETRMIQTEQLLRGMFEELKEMCRKPDLELLQTLGDILERSESLQLFMPRPVNPELGSWAITGMSERLNYFRVYITLDRKLGSYHMPLFEDLKRLQCSPDHQDMPCNPSGLEYVPMWGAQIFTFGKHYWEADVRNSGNWIIGLCDDSWTKRSDMLLDSEGLFLLLCVKVDDCFSLFSTSPLLPHYVRRPQGQLGVFLDYECGKVSFVNVAQSSLICSFLSCSFSSPLRPFICFEPTFLRITKSWPPSREF